jgi:4-amino-4-deoxy-L-arabinose transferase-like glycosyltransferase
MKKETVFAYRKKDMLYPLAILIAWIASFILLTNRIGEPLGGFHSALEATNMLAADRFADSSFFYPTLDGKEIYLETPGLYPYLVYLFSGFHPNPQIIARIISLLSFLGISGMLYLIGSRIRSKSAGCLAAILYTCLPISILLGRNIQGDSLSLFFFLTALWLFLRTDREDNPQGASAASLYGAPLLFALAALTNYLVWFGALGWLVWIRQTAPQKAHFKEKRFRTTLLLGAGLPLLIYSIWLIPRPSVFFEGFLGTFHVNTPFLFFRSIFLQKEFLWALSPLMAMTVIVSCFLYFLRKDRRHPLLTYMLLANLIPFLFFAKYSFYLLSAIPFLLLLTSIVLDEFRLANFPRFTRWPILALLFLSGLFTSLVITVHAKYGYQDFEQTKMLLMGANGGSHNGVVLVNSPIFYAYNRELHYYFRKDSLVFFEKAATDPNQQLDLSNLNVRMLLRLFTREGATMKSIKRTEYITTCFGYGLQIQKPTHFFQIDSWKIIGNLPNALLYMHALQEIPTLEISFHPQNTKVFYKDNKLIFQDR